MAGGEAGGKTTDSLGGLLVWWGGRRYTVVRRVTRGGLRLRGTGGGG